MKKIILSLAAVLAFALTSDAQTRKGTVLLGAGSQMSDTEWTTLAITPKVGYFVQDGIAIGALINFQSDNTDKGAYELNNSVAEIGVFGRYYVSNNLFTEIALSSKSASTEEFLFIEQFAQVYIEEIPQFDSEGNALMAWQDIEEVVENSDKSLNFNLGLGYTIVWREHFAVEPYVHLDLIVDGEKVTAATNETRDLSGSEFVAGVNFSLFF